MKDQANCTANEIRTWTPTFSLALGSRAINRVLVLILVLSFLFVFQPQRGSSENLPMFRGNPSHTGVYEATGVPKLSQVKWMFHVKGQLISVACCNW